MPTTFHVLIRHEVLDSAIRRLVDYNTNIPTYTSYEYIINIHYKCKSVTRACKIQL